MSYHSAKQIIANSCELQKITVHCNLLQQINALLIPLLPPELRDQVRVADYKNTVLFLELRSANYSLTLRFKLPSLLQSLCLTPLLYRLQDIKFYVQPSYP